MVEQDGKWIMAGHETLDETPLKTVNDLYELVEKVGFLPLFSNEIPGFSVEERSYKYAWWGEQPEHDPWMWREVAAREKRIAYGKLFWGRAGFISREWYPYFAVTRRDGYDYDSRYEDGLANRKSKMIIDTLTQYDSLPSHILKALAGFGKGKEKGYESTINQLQMQTYITVTDFARKKNKKGEEYGWAAAHFMLTEHLFGEEHTRSCYAMGTEKAAEKIRNQMKDCYSVTNEKILKKIIYG